MVRGKLLALLLAGILAAATVNAGAAGASPKAPHDRAHYCGNVDAYRIRSCAQRVIPDSPVGRQLRWVLASSAEARPR
jgi:hypothetical protein